MITKKNILQRTSGILTCLLTASTVYSQCLNQVFNTSGTSVVSGVSINVTSFGAANTNTVYCPSTTPYNIGYLIGAGTANSGYTFQFSPAVDSVTLNFSGISNSPPYQEIVIVEINGVRYPIPLAGSSNGCDQMAVLTPEGYITGCTNCSVSGWNGTTIAGPVSMVTVIDSSALNGQGGNQSLFSLFFCDSINTSGIHDNLSSNNDFYIYPNPTKDKITIQSSTKNNNIELFDPAGKLLMKNFLNVNRFEIDLSRFHKGMYFLTAGNKENPVHRIIIKE